MEMLVKAYYNNVSLPTKFRTENIKEEYLAAELKGFRSGLLN